VNWKDKEDLLWISIISALILIWSSLPNWAGQLAQTNELHFRGVYFDPQDYSVDSSMMQSGMRGDWAYEFRFTTELPHPAYVRMFYITLGHISKWIHLAPNRPMNWRAGYLVSLPCLQSTIYSSESFRIDFGHAQVFFSPH